MGRLTHLQLQPLHSLKVPAGQLHRGPTTHLPPLHALLQPLHTVSKWHAEPSFAGTCRQTPVPRLQKSSVHGLLSLQALGFTGVEQTPDEGSQTPVL